LGVHHPLPCALQVVRDGDELEKKQKLWIELLGILFSVSLDCHNQFIIFFTTLN
jgi:hypothetical protein